MLSFAALVAGGSLSAQNLIVGADFATRFDNREYANNDFNESQTLFSARFTPRIGVEWMEKKPADLRRRPPAELPGSTTAPANRS